jgi:hypothetical protein
VAEGFLIDRDALFAHKLRASVAQATDEINGWIFADIVLAELQPAQLLAEAATDR